MTRAAALTMRTSWPSCPRSGTRSWRACLGGALRTDERSRALRFGSASRFAGGSFVPEEYQDEVEHLPVDFVTPTGGACAYGALGLELDDF